jgi:hypothetical protein
VGGWERGRKGEGKGGRGSGDTYEAWSAKRFLTHACLECKRSISTPLFSMHWAMHEGMERQAKSRILVSYACPASVCPCMLPHLHYA